MTFSIDQCPLHDMLLLARNVPASDANLKKGGRGGGIYANSTSRKYDRVVIKSVATINHTGLITTIVTLSTSVTRP